MTQNDKLMPLARANREPVERTLFWLIWALNVVFSRVTRRDWRHREKIPQTGGVIFVGNHISNVDPLSFGQFLAFSGRWPRFLAKASLFRLPVIGRIISRCGQIPVERDSRLAGHALDVAVRAVKEGKAISVYPEGTITLDPDLWPMKGKTGAARIALETRCPVIPIGQWGVQDIMYGKQIHLPKFFPRKTLRLQAGDPVDLDDLYGRQLDSQVLSEATERMMDAITVLVADLRQETPPAVRYRPGRSQPKDDLP